MKTKFNGFLTLLLALVVQISFAQKKTITGKVSDSSGSLPGVSILLKGSNTGTETDFDGKYSLTAKTGDVLVFRYLGYKTVERVIGASNTINVTLNEDASVLDEIVVIGYGEQKRETATAAVNFLGAEAVENRPVGSVVTALQGQTPGLNISTANGQPGGNSQILLRGANSLGGNNEPLFIIDDIAVDEDSFQNINPNDIESISILKDASATAIYGNRATGGVIIIKTKRGKFNQKTSISYSGQTGFSFVPEAQFELTNTEQLLNIERDAGVAVGGGFGNAWVRDKLGITSSGALSDEEIARISADPSFNTNWQDLLLRTGRFQSHNIAISGGSEKMTTYNSIGYFEQEGITLRSKLERITLRSNTTLKKDKFTLSTNIGIGYSVSDFPGGIGGAGTTSGSLSNPFIVPFVGKPYLPAFNADGSRDIIGNPEFADAAGFLNTPFIAQNVAAFDTNRRNEIRLTGSLQAKYDITENFNVLYNFGIDHINREDFAQQPANSIRGFRVNNENAQFQGSQNQAISKDTRMNSDIRFNYSNTFNDVHNIGALGAVEYLFSQIDGFSFAQTGLLPGLEGSAGFIDGNTTEDPDGDGVLDYFYIPAVGSFVTNVAQFSVLGKVNYDYDQKFGVDFTFRRDGSSRFLEDIRFGNFFAVGSFVNLTRIFGNTDFVNDVKLRGSYGTTANDRVAGGYYGGLVLPFDLFGNGTGYNGTVSLVPNQLGNRTLTWENTTKTNIGIDFILDNRRLTGSLDVFRNVTNDLFLSAPNTLISGFGAIQGNNGKLQNTGVEAIFNYQLFNTEDFSWSIGANASYLENEILELDGVEPDADGEIVFNAAQQSPESVGRSINTFNLVRWAGVNPANGRPLYLDKEGNVTETYNEADRVWTDKSSIPRYQGGFNTDINYKGFFVNAIFNFSADVWRNNGTLGVAEDNGLIGIANVTTNLLDAWKEPGDITSIPALTTGGTRLLLTDRYLEDASFVRLKNLQVGYNIPKAFLDKTPFSSVRIYGQGENLITWTKWRGFDPEFSPFANSDFFSFPNGRSATIGIDLKF
ncbi:SusC/RagA family TonB-linked outer membrane protein [uncultured Polaribacter sp.]|uniref:SusC/RagA family TonB-linked outer membrane protein n=1 Tax=uncultured Polaribacter sp. TaxID=174711 RepID=UPI0026379684|nr:SusC/RagA family TonB-linked outer membrane protein [uncultured Polaribacter sp.]